MSLSKSPFVRLLGPAWTRTFRCVWMLEEIGTTTLPYVLDETARPLTAKVTEFQPTGKVPVFLEYNDKNDTTQPSFVMTESSAINTYLADHYAPHLVPPPLTQERAQYDQIVSTISTELDSQLWLARRHTVLAKHFGHIPDAATAAATQFQRVQPVLAAQCHPYLLGTNFTAADILYMNCLDWAAEMGWALQGETDYVALCRQRPAYQRATAIREASLKALKEYRAKKKKAESKL